MVNSSWDLRLQDLEDVSVKEEVRHKILVLCNGIEKMTANRIVDLDTKFPQKQVVESKVDCLFLHIFLSPPRRWNPNSVCGSSWQKQWFGSGNVW